MANRLKARFMVSEEQAKRVTRCCDGMFEPGECDFKFDDKRPYHCSVFDLTTVHYGRDNVDVVMREYRRIEGLDSYAHRNMVMFREKNCHGHVDEESVILHTSLVDDVTHKDATRLLASPRRR